MFCTFGGEIKEKQGFSAVTSIGALAETNDLIQNYIKIFTFLRLSL
jgi:hypothetical protein